jgi:hypothetical protein
LEHCIADNEQRLCGPSASRLERQGEILDGDVLDLELNA